MCRDFSFLWSDPGLTVTPRRTLPPGRERLGTLAEDIEIARIALDLPTLTFSNLVYDAKPIKVGQSWIDRWGRKAGAIDNLARGQERHLLEPVVDSERRSGAGAVRRDEVAVGLEEIGDSGRIVATFSGRVSVGFAHPITIA